MGQRSDDIMVYIIDDEPSVRRALRRLMHSAGIGSTAFSSVDDFITVDIETVGACVVADVQMPGGHSLNLPGLLKQRGLNLPVIYVTANGMDSTRERVRSTGAAGFFRKPVDGQALIDAIFWAIDDQPRPD